jgi:hypothetical protein
MRGSLQRQENLCLWYVMMRQINWYYRHCIAITREGERVEEYNTHKHKQQSTEEQYRVGNFPGVEITTRQLAKCECNLELASIFLLTRQLGECFFPPLSESFFPANWVLFLPDSEIQTHTWHGDLFIIMTHTQSWWSIFRVGLVQTKCTLHKCSAKTWFWRGFLWFGE